MLQKILRLISELSFQFWFVSMVLFSFLIVPTIFSKYESIAAGAILANVFPAYGYYLLAFIGVHLISSGFCLKKTETGLAAVAMALILLQGFFYFPSVEAARQTMLIDDAARASFRSLHGQSQVVNLVMLITGLAVQILRSRENWRAQ